MAARVGGRLSHFSCGLRSHVLSTCCSSRKLLCFKARKKKMVVLSLERGFCREFYRDRADRVYSVISSSGKGV